MSAYLRVLLAFVVLAGLSVAAWLLATSPGSVTLRWQGWRIDTSASVLLVSVLVACLIGILLYRLWRGLGGLPRRVRAARAQRRREVGYNALTRGMIAIAQGDAAEARRQATRASELLGRPPGALLIGAQAAQLEGRSDLAQKFYAAMAEDRETELLGLRGLLGVAEQQGDQVRALTLAERAHKLAPTAAWALTRLFHLQIAARQWEGAERTLRQAIAAKAIGESSGKHTDAALLVQLSLMADRNGNRPLAIERAKRALALDPALLPASLQLAALYCADSQPRRARKTIEAAWQKQPHPDLARLYAIAIGEADLVKRYRALEPLEKLQPTDPETHRALARAALDAKLWGEARRHLKSGGSDAPDAGFCRLYAELEQNENGNAAAARDWLAQASAAEPDPAWLCRNCGAAAREWSALCSQCGGFDTLSWGRRARVAALAAAPSGTVLADASEAPPPAGLPEVRQALPART
jgi:HemY protein